jgi:hypothetical protein
MSSQEQTAEERARRKREDADVEAHAQDIEELDEDEAARRRRRRRDEATAEDEAGRRRR